MTTQPTIELSLVGLTQFQEDLLFAATLYFEAAYGKPLPPTASPEEAQPWLKFRKLLAQAKQEV